MAELVQQKVEQLNRGLQNLEVKINQVGKDVKTLLPKDKIKHVFLPLKDPIKEDIFKLILFNAGSTASYYKSIRQAQLRITYTLLYHLKLRLNELRFRDIQNAIQTQELRIVLSKTNKSKTFTVPVSAVKELQNLQNEFEILGKTYKFEYLFGKKVPPSPKTLLRIVNHYLANICKLCKIYDNVTSHSFIVSLISRLLRVNTVQNVRDIIRHEDIKSTMQYNRYRLTKSAIQNIQQQAKKVTDFIKIDS